MSYLKLYKDEALLVAEALKQSGVKLPAHIIDEFNKIAAVPSFEIHDQFGERSLEVYSSQSEMEGGEKEELIGLCVNNIEGETLATIHLQRDQVTELVCGMVQLIYKQDITLPLYPFTELSMPMQKMLNAIQNAAAKSLNEQKKAEAPPTGTLHQAQRPTTGSVYSSLIPSDHHAALKILNLALGDGIGTGPEHGKYKSIISIICHAVECNRIDDLHKVLTDVFADYDLSMKHKEMVY